jgi:hypothetical protein
MGGVVSAVEIVLIGGLISLRNDLGCHKGLNAKAYIWS